MHKKAISLCALAACAALLASCGGPKGDQTYEQVTARHVDAVFDELARASLPADVAKAAQKTRIAISFSGAQASGELTADGSGAMDASSGTALSQVSLDVSGKVTAEGVTGSGKASLDVFAAGAESFFRLRALSVTAPGNEQLAMMADLAKGPFLDKWVKLPQPSDLGQSDPMSGVREAVTKDPRNALKALREALKANFPLVKTADLGFDAASGDYSYAVAYSGGALADALDAAIAQLGGTGAQKLDASARADLSGFSGTGKLVVNELRPETGSLELTLSASGSAETVKLAVSRRGDDFSMTAAPSSGSGKITVSLAGADGRVEALDAEGKPAITGTFKLKPRRGGADVSGVFTLNPGSADESAVVTFSVTGDARPDPSVKLTAPADAVPFQDMMGGIMGAGMGSEKEPGFDPYAGEELPMDPATQGELEELMGQDAKVTMPSALPAKPKK